MQENDVIEQSNHEEQAVRARLRPANAPRPTLRPAGLSGLEVLDAIFAGELPPPPMGETLDFLPIRMTPGEAVFQGRPHRRHYNPLGTVHGGWFATLLDSAVGCAIHTTLSAGRRLHHSGTQGQPGARADRCRAPGARGRQGHPRRAPDWLRRRPNHRAGRQALRTRHHHLADLRHPRGHPPGRPSHPRLNRSASCHRPNKSSSSPASPPASAAPRRNDLPSAAASSARRRRLGKRR